MFSIGITTFKRRCEMVEKLINDIKQFLPDVEIILTVNADYKESFDEEYRKKILTICAEQKNVFPVIFPQFTGLSKMWNTILLNASSEYVLILNDDLLIERDIFPELGKQIEEVKAKTEDQMIKINQSYSHFVCSKTLADEMGYFDERFLAFGEEDGDFTWRYIKRYGHAIKSIEIAGISNQAEGYLIPHPNMEVEDIRGTRFVPKFNRNFVNQKYKDSSLGIRGMFARKKKQVIKDQNQYPYERFKREHYDEM